MIKNIKNLFFTLVAVFLTATSCFAFSLRETTLKFVQISDSHISERENTSFKMLSQSKNFLKDAIEQINKEEAIDFVMFTGDMVDEPYYDSYRDFWMLLYELKYPVLMTLGNHDAHFEDSKNEDSVSVEEVVKLISDCNPNQKQNKSYWSVGLRGNFHIIALDLRTDKISSNGYISEEQLKFLDKELNENKDKVVLIFEHHPVLEPFQSDSHKVLNAQDYFDVLNKYTNPIAIFSGHYHTTKITRLDNIIHVSSPSLVTYPNAFRIVNITNYRDRTIFDFYFKETKLKEAQAEAKANTIAAATFAGVEKDRNTTIVIKKKIVKDKKAKKKKNGKDESKI